jgi:hypothetical protein
VRWVVGPGCRHLVARRRVDAHVHERDVGHERAVDHHGHGVGGAHSERRHKGIAVAHVRRAEAGSLPGAGAARRA